MAIVGVAESDLGEVGPGPTPVDLMTQAARRALEDCGLQPGDVDGLFSASSQLPMPTLNLGEELGIQPRHTPTPGERRAIQPRHSDATNIGAPSSEAHVINPRASVEAGLCDVALIA